MKGKMTIKEFKEIIQQLPENGVIRLQNTLLRKKKSGGDSIISYEDNIEISRYKKTCDLYRQEELEQELYIEKNLSYYKVKRLLRDKNDIFYFLTDTHENR